MIEAIPAISTAITIAKRLKEVTDKVRDAEIKNLLADLSLELANAKLERASIIGENAELKEQIRNLQALDGEPCPKCRKRTWVVEKSEPDEIFGELGSVRRTYRCVSCDFTEQELIHAKR